MRRVITFICVFSVLVFALCVPAFADDSGYFSVSSVYVKDGPSDTWVENSNYSWSMSSDHFVLLSWKPADVTTQTGLKFTLDPAGYVMVQSGYYYNFKFTFYGNVLPSTSLVNERSFSLTFSFSDGTSKTINPYSSSLDSSGTTHTWTSNFALYVGDGTPVRVTHITFETNYHGDTNGSYRVNVSSSVTIEPTPELKQHLEIMQKLQEIYSGLSDEIQAQTEELTNGWDNTGDEPADVGGAADDLGQAESEALGGKSDSEIQQEVNNALSGEGLPDFETSFVIADLFDRLLWSFGTGYQSLLILSLTLGLAAFLIGRSWSKGV